VVKIISWNVNGLRSVLRKNFLEFLESEKPQILCLQETKAGPNDVEQLWPSSYRTYWNPASKKGYAGTAIFTQVEPLRVVTTMGCPEHEGEGRLIAAEYPEFHLLNLYVPNSKRGLIRLPYRQQWDCDLLKFLKDLERTKPVIVCGDLNVAHQEIDIAHPKTNVKNPGFCPEERANFTRLLEAGFIDTFREFESGGGHYTWWTPITNARERNLGWRIDYVLISKSLRPRLKRAFSQCNVMGSDHCPVGVELS
jgi:exodeoxyribonuclease-3